MNTVGLPKQIFNWFISRKMAFEKISMDPETGNPANEESIKTAYFGWSFHFKQPYNERGGLGTSKECGENNWPSSKSIRFSQTQNKNKFKLWEGVEGYMIIQISKFISSNLGLVKNI